MPEPARRIVAVVLPELLIELVAGLPASAPEGRSLAREGRRQGQRGQQGAGQGRGRPGVGRSARNSTGARPRPLGVVLVASEADSAAGDEAAAPLPATTLLSAVNAEARRCGVREGQSIAEASALVAGFAVRRVPVAAVRRALEGVAEATMAFGATVAIGAPDTVWVDVSGSAHLFGGEAALAAELSSRIRGMGHAVRAAVAAGPTLAQMFARWAQPVPLSQGEPGVHLVPAERTAEALADLPVIALPLADELREWLVRLGVLTIGELMKLPACTVGPRLGEGAARVLELCAGRDRTPLEAFRPARSIVEGLSWDHEASGNEPLLFALRGLVARVSARLAGRGEAAQSLVLSIEHAPAFARFRGVSPVTQLRFALGSPLYREEQLRRVVTSRLERVKLPAPSVGLKLEVPVLTEAVARQLEFSEFLSGTSGAVEELPLIVAELVADIGEDRVGVLDLCDSHRPEGQSKLGPIPARAGQPESRGKSPAEARDRPARLRKALPQGVPGAPSRLLPEPVPLSSPWHVGAALAIGERLYTVERIIFEHRLEGVEWWSRSPVARDYVRLWLQSADGITEGLAYIERRSQRAYLQAIAD